jgi:hypothetical protein
MHSKYSLKYHKHSPTLVENANVWGVSKYHDFLWRANQSGPLQKNKIELQDAPTTN